MIFKKSLTTVVLCMAWIDGIFGTSYSKVYVNSGTNVGSYPYVGYGAPAVAYGAAIAQLSNPPVQSVVPYPRAASFVAPCVSPCVPQQSVAQVANAPLVAYTAPRASVVVAGDVPSNYEYAYVVYDDRTGDQKAARELSDGGVVRGQYSFLQPDGYVREVQYTADDVAGFNAVVSYLPAGGEKTVYVTKGKPGADVKPEALKQTESTKEDTTPDSSVEVASSVAPASQKEASTAASVEKSIKDASVAKKPAKKDKPKGTKEVESLGESISAEVTKEKPPVEVTSKENAVPAVVESVQAPQPVPAIVTSTLPLGYVSYDQLLKCIQKMQIADRQAKSPLTYILLPSNFKPC